MNPGNLVWVPNAPLSMYSVPGEDGFWHVGVIVTVYENGEVLIYSESHDIEKIHSSYIRCIW